MVAPQTNDTQLIGMKEITAYAQRSEKTVLKYIYEHGFPARQVNRRWLSDKLMIDEWRRKFVTMPQPKNSEPIPKTAPPKKASSGVRQPRW